MAQKNHEFKKIPLLALRGLHVFPGMLLTFDVERPASIAALNSSIRADQLIFLSAQKDLSADMPTQDEIYPVGTVSGTGAEPSAAKSSRAAVMTR